MLSYQHGYHAGGLADVHKHVAFCLVLARLTKKPKPFCVIDLYAGEGEYDLAAPKPQKTADFKSGIGRVWGQTDGPPAVQGYLDVLHRLYPGGDLRHYPGSPAIARAFLRENDRLILNELHATAYPELGRWARKDPRISVHKRDGLEALLALTPPEVRRGVVLIDPSYEVKTEYASVPEKLAAAVPRWREGTFIVWYPVLQEGRHRALLAGLTAEVEGDVLNCELIRRAAPRGQPASGLLGTGLAIVNPPWKFDADMAEAGDWLAAKLGPAKHTTTWLRGPTEG